MSALMKLAAGSGLVGSASVKHYADDVFNINTYPGTGALKVISNAVALFIATVSNTVSGNSSIIIPAGVTSLKLEGKGTDGTYYAGQPYIAPGYDVGGNLHTTDRYGWTNDYIEDVWIVNDPIKNTQSYYDSVNNDPYAYTNANKPTGIGQIPPTSTTCSGPYTGYSLRTFHFISVDVYPGQTYIAASSTNGIASTATINGTTYTFPGGISVAAVITTFNITIPNQSQTLSYVTTGTGNVKYTYTPDSSNLSGGLVLIKARDSASKSFALYDTVRGVNKRLTTNTNAAQIIETQGVTAFGNGSFTLGTQADVNGSSINEVAYSIARSIKFLDIVTYVGDGSTNRVLNHLLGIMPGMLTVKAVGTTGNWITRHASATGEVYFEQTIAQAASFTQITGMTDTTFTVSGLANTNGVTYISYIFANDAGIDGLIQTGSYIGGNQTISAVVSSNGTTSIPAGVTSIKLVGRGKNSTSTAGQPYIAPTAAVYDWDQSGSWQMSTVGTGPTTNGYPQLTASTSVWWSGPPTGPNQTTTSEIAYSDWGSPAETRYHYIQSTAHSILVTAGDPGQPYIAPSSSPAVDSTATINGTTYTFPGDVGLTTFNIIIPSQVQNLTYVIPSGGSITYTYNVVGTSKITLGWEPQAVWIKNLTAAGNWVLLDNIRGLPVDSNGAVLTLNTSTVETQAAYISISATGFTIVSTNADVGTTGQTYAYMAIRRPNKPATSGNQVYNAIARNGTTGAVTIPGAGFNGDLCIYKQRSISGPTVVLDKLRGGKTYMLANTTAIDAITGYTDFNGFTMDGVAFGTNYSTTATELISLFKRYPKVFDIVNFNQTLVNHSLGVVPELMISKCRSSVGSWNVYHKTINATKYLSLESSAASVANTFYNGLPTDTSFNTSIVSSSSVATITITNGGSNYTSAPAVSFSGGSGSGVTGTVNMYASGSTGSDSWSSNSSGNNANSSIANIDLAYTSSPTITFSGSSILTQPTSSVELKPLYSFDVVYYSRVTTNETIPVPDGVYEDFGHLLWTTSMVSPRIRVTVVNDAVTNVEILDAGLTKTANDLLYFYIGPPISHQFIFDGNGSVVTNKYWALVTYYGGTMNNGNNISLNYSGGGVTGGSFAVATYQTSYVTTTYSVGSVTINTPGNGYLTPPAVSFSSGGGSGAAATAVLGAGKFDNYIGYLFATYPGISKVFDYIGNGTSQTIPCGFSNGARFVMLKRDDGISDWFMWDTVRGIVAGNDPYLSINTTATEVITDDAIDPDPSGFIINQLASTNMNINGAKYIGFAIA